jgi:pantothenate kinase-related protein Tda10
MDKRCLTRDFGQRQCKKAQLLLDGLIICHHELGDLGKQLERLLRERGVRSTFDPAFSTRCH